MLALVEYVSATTNSGPKTTPQTRSSAEELLIKSGVFSVCRSLLGNSSTAIHDVLSARILRFSKENTFTNMAAGCVADMVYSAVRVSGSAVTQACAAHHWSSILQTNPAKNLPIFLRYISDEMKRHVSGKGLFWLLTCTIL